MSSSSTTLRRGDCFEFEKHRYRYVARFEKPEPHIFVIDMDDPKPTPIRWSGTDLARFSKQNPSLKKLDRIIRNISKSEYESDLARENTRYKLIEELTKKPELYDDDKRWSLLKEYAAKVNKTAETVYVWCRRFWKRGMVPQALRSSYYCSGRVTSATEGALVIKGRDESGETINSFVPEAKKSRGASPMPLNCLVRPKRTKDNPRDDLPPRYSIYCPTHDEIKKIIVIAWRFYRTAHFKSMTGATKEVLTEMFIEKDEHGMPVLDKNGNCIPFKLGFRPTYRQIKRLVDKVKSKSQQYKARFGDAKFLNNIAARFGNKRDDCVGPGDVAEIDCTKFDVYLVDQATRLTIIGKANLVLVVDRWSNLIIGWHLTLDNPSWAEAKLALLNIFADWRAMGKEMGIAVHETDLVANGRMPDRIFADRGELFHKGPELLCAGFETMVTNAPPLISVAKGLVESLFYTEQLPFRGEAPGYDPPEEHGKRRVAARSKDAIYTLPVLRKLIFRRILTHNRSQLKNYSATPEEIMLDLPISPLDIYARDSEVLTGSGSNFSFEYAKEQLMVPSVATVVHNGIVFGHCRYQARQIKEWCVLARLGDAFDVNILYETNSVDEITVIHPKDSSIKFKAKLVSEDSSKWVGYSHAERHLVHLVARKNKRNNSDANTAEDLMDYLFRKWKTQEEMAATAAALEAAKAVSYAKRLSDGPKALEKERRAERARTAALMAAKAVEEERQEEAETADVGASDGGSTRRTAKAGGTSKSSSKGAAPERTAKAAAKADSPKKRHLFVPDFGESLESYEAAEDD